MMQRVSPPSADRNLRTWAAAAVAAAVPRWPACRRPTGRCRRTTPNRKGRTRAACSSTQSPTAAAQDGTMWKTWTLSSQGYPFYFLLHGCEYRNSGFYALVLQFGNQKLLGADPTILKSSPNTKSTFVSMSMVSI
ncbi:hypothetical protein V5799_009070 [Amblyomma americanum]|uniref:Uncharacterized protein n=1 Tax=Amblyomma americanum TaxID=6943 RepID=A0AAQ4FD28_AMBAM